MDEPGTKQKRTRYGVEERRLLLEKYGASGQTVPDFAQAHGIKVTTLRQWLWKHKPTPPPGFQELLLPVSAPAATVEITLGRELTIKLRGEVSARYLAQILHRLRPSC